MRNSTKKLMKRRAKIKKFTLTWSFFKEASVRPCAPNQVIEIPLIYWFRKVNVTDLLKNILLKWWCWWKKCRIWTSWWQNSFFLEYKQCSHTAGKAKWIINVIALWQSFGCLSPCSDLWCLYLPEHMAACVSHDLNND